MEIGIFAKTFNRPTLEATLDAVVAHGLKAVQFNLVCAGLPTLPDAVDDALITQIREAMIARGLHMTALSGTFNLIHPDEQYRQEHLRRLRVLASACKAMGTDVITLCTGTRDAADMWRAHPDNDTPAAWRDLTAMMEAALQIADDAGITLAIEPETGNVVSSAAKGRRLIDEMRSARLKVVIDGANLFYPGELSRMTEVLDEAFDLLGEQIIFAHAKDVAEVNGQLDYRAAGKGTLDWDHYLSRLRRAGFDGALVMHGLPEAEVEGAAAFLRGRLQAGL